MFRVCFIATAVWLSAVSARTAELEFDFAKTNATGLPAGFRSAVTSAGRPGDWRVLTDIVPPAQKRFSPGPNITDKRPVLAQVSRDTTGEAPPASERFCVLLDDADDFGDFTFTARFKLVEGDKERMAGLVFRAKDEKNYYCLRASGLGNTVKFLRFVKGDYDVPAGTNIVVTAGVWHELSVECFGNNIRCRLDGQQLFPDIQDSNFAAGKVGFWTKSDAVSYFADAHVTFTPRIPLAQTVVQDVMKNHPRLVGLKVFAGAKEKPQDIRLIASNEATDLGKLAQQLERDVIEKDVMLFGRAKTFVQVTLPLKDRNGEVIAAVRVMLTDFTGQTEQTAISRAMPIVALMQERLRAAKDLFEK
ncbi:MAG: hypothetical protein HY300_02715 [Verrucomicrobia bacterium]|nr:hypothetical protein [Verrucomicrobiota bacterium]